MYLFKRSNERFGFNLDYVVSLTAHNQTVVRLFFSILLHPTL